MDEKKFEITAVRKFVLNQRDIDEIIKNALKKGIAHWCNKTEVVEEKRCSDKDYEQVARGGTLIFYDKNGAKWELTLDKFLAGFKLWFEDGDDTYGAVEHGEVNVRSLTEQAADLIIQFALFEEVYFF